MCLIGVITIFVAMASKVLSKLSPCIGCNADTITFSSMQNFEKSPQLAQWSPLGFKSNLKEAQPDPEDLLVGKC